MRTFEIYNTAKRDRKPCAHLLFDERKDHMRIVIDDDAKPEDLPFMLALFVERNQREIPDKWARRWIAERVPPQGRQNLGEVLRANGLDHYDEVALLASSEGRSAQDDFLVRETTRPRVEYAVVQFPEEGASSALLWRAQLGANLARRRKEVGLTQQQLAEKTGIDQGAISRIESGKGNPTLSTLETIAEGVGGSLSIEIRGNCPER